MADNFLSKLLDSLTPEPLDMDLDEKAHQMAGGDKNPMAQRDTYAIYQKLKDERNKAPLPSDGDFARNMLMKGVIPPSTVPNFVGKDNVWFTPEGPITKDQMPPSPLKLEDQEQIIKDTARSNLTGQPIPVRQPASTSTSQTESVKTKSVKPNALKEQPEEKEQTPEETPEMSQPEVSPQQALLERLIAEASATAQEDKELKDALQRQQDMMNYVGFQRGAQQIGAALGGVAPDEKFLENLNESTKAKVAGIKDIREQQKVQQQEKREKVKFAMDTEKGMLDLDKAKLQMVDAKAMQDPNSDLSKAWREAARTRFKLAGVKIPANLISDSLPASKVKELFPSGDIVDDLIKLKGMEESAALRKEAKNERNKQQAQQQVDRYVQHTQDKFKDDVNKVKEGRTAVAALESAMRDPSSVKDLQAIYNMIKAFDPNSAVREGELVMAQKGQSYVDNAKTLFSKIGNNPRLLTGRYLKDVYDYAKSAQEARENNYRETMDSRLDYAKKRLGLPSGQEIFIDPLYEERKTKSTPTQQSLPFNVDAAKAELERRKKGK